MDLTDRTVKRLLAIHVHHEMEHLGHLRGFFAVGRPADLGEVNPEAIGSATTGRRQVHGRVREVSLAVFRLPRVEVFPLMAESAGHVRTTRLAGFYQIGRAHVELQSPCNLVCRLLLEKKKPSKRRTPN